MRPYRRGGTSGREEEDPIIRFILYVFVIGFCILLLFTPGCAQIETQFLTPAKCSDIGTVERKGGKCFKQVIIINKNTGKAEMQTEDGVFYKTDNAGKPSVARGLVEAMTSVATGKFINKD